MLGIVCTDHHTDEGAPAVAGIVPHCVAGRLRRLVGEAGVRLCSSRLFKIAAACPVDMHGQRAHTQRGARNGTRKGHVRGHVWDVRDTHGTYEMGLVKFRGVLRNGTCNLIYWDMYGTYEGTYEAPPSGLRGVLAVDSLFKCQCQCQWHGYTRAYQKHRNRHL